MTFLRLAVGGVCLHNEKVVLLKRKDDAEIYPSIWELPSGGVEIGEDPSDALVREVFEETGLQIKIGICVGYFLYQSKDRMPCIQVNHLCVPVDPIPESIRISEEHTCAEWVPLDRTLLYNTSKNVRKILENTIKIIHCGLDYFCI